MASTVYIARFVFKCTKVHNDTLFNILSMRNSLCELTENMRNSSVKSLCLQNVIFKNSCYALKFSKHVKRACSSRDGVIYIFVEIHFACHLEISHIMFCTKR